MVLRALRPPMLFGASLPGMIFPAQHPAEGSNSYHYGSYATHNQDKPISHLNHIVSIPLWFLRNCRHLLIVLILLFNVSIPLWFLRNISSLETAGASVTGFHTTMVLTQLRSFKGTLSVTIVSIPLWFLRNVNQRIGVLALGYSFHTTMVLTQQKDQSDS